MPTYSIPFRVLQDKRALPAVVADYFTIPASGTGTFTVRLLELPISGVITPPSVSDAIVVRQVDPDTHVHNPALHRVYTKITSGTPNYTQWLENTDTYNYGFLTMNFDANLDRTIEFRYQGQGSLVFASDVNELSDGSLIQDGAIKSRCLDIDEAVDFDIHGAIFKDSVSGNRFKIGVDGDGAITTTPLL